MARQDVPNISHLSGPELERVATALVSANLRTLLAHREEIAALKVDELQRLVDLAVATRADCGGIGCG